MTAVSWEEEASVCLHHYMSFRARTPALDRKNCLILRTVVTTITHSSLPYPSIWQRGILLRAEVPAPR